MTPEEGEIHWRPANQEEFEPVLKSVDRLILPYSSVFITLIIALEI